MESEYTESQTSDPIGRDAALEFYALKMSLDKAGSVEEVGVIVEKMFINLCRNIPLNERVVMEIQGALVRWDQELEKGI